MSCNWAEINEEGNLRWTDGFCLGERGLVLMGQYLALRQREPNDWRRGRMQVISREIARLPTTRGLGPEQIIEGVEGVLEKGEKGESGF